MKHLKTYEEKNFNINNHLSDNGKTLSLNYLNLTELPELPNSLERLYCYNNNLTELPELPNSLKELSCGNNNLPYNDLDGYWKWFKEEHPDLWAAKQMGLY